MPAPSTATGSCAVVGACFGDLSAELEQRQRRVGSVASAPHAPTRRRRRRRRRPRRRAAPAACPPAARRRARRPPARRRARGCRSPTRRLVLRRCGWRPDRGRQADRAATRAGRRCAWPRRGRRPPCVSPAWAGRGGGCARPGRCASRSRSGRSGRTPRLQGRSRLRRERDIGVAHEHRGELDGVELGVRLRDRRPHEHRPTRFGDVPSDPARALRPGRLAAPRRSRTPRPGTPRPR